MKFDSYGIVDKCVIIKIDFNDMKFDICGIVD
jgi:hypothetical protein